MQQVILNDDVLYNTIGGKTSLTSFLNTLSRMVSIIFDLGQTIGSAIKYKITKKSCN